MRRVRDFIEVSDHTSLENLIKFLQTIRDSLPAGSEPELKVRGDDVFGRRLTISYLRTLTSEEEAMEARYAHLSAEDDDSAMDDLTGALDKVEYQRKAKGG